MIDDKNEEHVAYVRIAPASYPGLDLVKELRNRDIHVRCFSPPNDHWEMKYDFVAVIYSEARRRGAEIIILEDWTSAYPSAHEGKGIVSFPRDAWLHVDGVTYFNHTVQDRYHSFLPQLDWEKSSGPFEFEGGNTIPLRDCGIVLTNEVCVDPELKKSLRKKGNKVYDFDLPDDRHLDFHINGTPKSAKGGALIYTKATYRRNQGIIHEILDCGFEPIEVCDSESDSGAPNFIAVYGVDPLVFASGLAPRTNDKIRDVIGEESVIEVGGEFLESLAGNGAGLRCVSNEVYEK